MILSTPGHASELSLVSLQLAPGTTLWCVILGGAASLFSPLLLWSKPMGLRTVKACGALMSPDLWGRGDIPDPDALVY